MGEGRVTGTLKVQDLRRTLPGGNRAPTRLAGALPCCASVRLSKGPAETVANIGLYQRNSRKPKPTYQGVSFNNIRAKSSEFHK